MVGGRAAPWPRRAKHSGSSTLEESRVRSGLAAGGKRIRTLGPTLTKRSAGCCGREIPERVGFRIKLWSSREMAIGCAPSPRPRTRRDRASNLVCSGRKSGTFATARSGRHRSSKQPSSRSPSTIALPIPNQPGNRERGGGRRSRYWRYAESARATATFPSSGSAMVLRPASRPRSADAGEQGQDQGR